MNELRSSPVQEAQNAKEKMPLVLVVDDYLDAQSMYGFRLRHAGYRVAFASTGEEAVALARELRPDAIVMDLCLKGKDGWTATRELRADPDVGSVPIVAVSGHALPEYEKRAYESGCDLFVRVPRDGFYILQVADHFGKRINDGLMKRFELNRNLDAQPRGIFAHFLHGFHSPFPLVLRGDDFLLPDVFAKYQQEVAGLQL